MRPEDHVPTPPPGRRRRARDAILVVLMAIALLVVFRGESIRNSGEELNSGLERTVVLAAGKPAGWIADRLPFDEAASDALASLDPDEDLGDEGGFDSATRSTRAEVKPAKDLRTLLVTGDSLAQPLDTELAQREAEDGDAKVIRDVKLGTGISKTGLLDWGKFSLSQARRDEPEAVVVFLGANEGFPIPVGGKQVQCCGAPWTAAYSARVKRVMDNYRRRGATRVYWLRLPLPRDASRQKIARAVNEGIDRAAKPYGEQVRVLDMERTFTPGGKYRDAIDGERVREADGIHLNEAGASVAARVVLTAVRRDFGG
jgi:hypothetical protein